MAKLTKPKTPKTLAIFCAKIAAEKIAADITVMDLTKYENASTDFFVICSSDSENQSKAIVDFLLRQAKNAGLDKPKVEGDIVADWILIDFFDVVFHIMLRHIRDYYQIEKLWNEATFYKFNSETSKLNKSTFSN